jgi:hypothetical protein
MWGVLLYRNPSNLNILSEVVEAEERLKMSRQSHRDLCPNADRELLVLIGWHCLQAMIMTK